jgi:hypothetical protein
MITSCLKEKGYTSDKMKTRDTSSVRKLIYKNNGKFLPGSLSFVFLLFIPCATVLIFIASGLIYLKSPAPPELHPVFQHFLHCCTSQLLKLLSNSQVPNAQVLNDFALHREHRNPQA